MLLQNPQLAYALLQAQVVMRIVNPDNALRMLHPKTNTAKPLAQPRFELVFKGGVTSSKILETIMFGRNSKFIKKLSASIEPAPVSKSWPVDNRMPPQQMQQPGLCRYLFSKSNLNFSSTSETAAACRSATASFSTTCSITGNWRTSWCHGWPNTRSGKACFDSASFTIDSRANKYAARRSKTFDSCSKRTDPSQSGEILTLSLPFVYCLHKSRKINRIKTIKFYQIRYVSRF